ncbi:MAG: hypothetical protein M1826_006092 [Phylliscum demangeonii]|nr:MAG: hypothetical protein M1826_006092 [Phylliscum demangeonii]
MAQSKPYEYLPTPDFCIADFCLIPIGTPTASVSQEIAQVQHLLMQQAKVLNLNFSMHSAGTTVEGSWDNVMLVIGRAHTMLHQQGIVRVQTDVRVGTRTDKKQSFEDKVIAVERAMGRDDVPGAGSRIE